MPATAVIRKQQFKVYYRPGTADEYVLNESFEHDLFFRGVPEYRIKPGHTILDIGAHIGCFSLLAASKTPAGRVYSFEPASETYAMLEKNMQTNNFPNIKTFRMAVAAKNGEAVLYHDLNAGNWGHTITKAISGETEVIKCITLESFIESEKIQHVDFIKFNCEGAEFGILLNTKPATLQKIKCMLVLYHGYLEDSISKEQLADYLSGAGFYIHYRYTNKDDDSGWMIAYRAGFMKNIAVIIRTIPLRISLVIKKFKRKIGRLKQVVFKKQAEEPDA